MIHADATYFLALALGYYFATIVVGWFDNSPALRPDLRIVEAASRTIGAMLPAALAVTVWQVPSSYWPPSLELLLALSF